MTRARGWLTLSDRKNRRDETLWEGEAPAEPGSFGGLRLGGSLPLSNDPCPVVFAEP